MGPLFRLGLWAALILSLALVGCRTVTSWLEDGLPPGQQDDDDSGADDDDSGDDDDDSGDDDDSASDDDDATGPLCPLPVPDHVTLSHPVWGDTFVDFYVPHSGWALAALHASRQLEGLQDQEIDLRLSPSWFFAVALEASYMGCSDDTPADSTDPSNQYQRRPETDERGCLDLPPWTVWVDICRMYDEDVACEEGGYEAAIPSHGQTSTGRDNVEPSLLTLGWYSVFAYSMLQWPSGAALQDPDAWFAAASDPRAMEKVLALTHRDNPYSGAVVDVVSGCADLPIEDCLSASVPNAERVVAVAAHTEALEEGVEQGACYSEELSASDILDYVDALSVLWPEADLAAGQAAALQALESAADGEDSAPFQDSAGDVLDALEEGLAVRLRCPGVGLQDYFGIGCPP